MAGVTAAVAASLYDVVTRKYGSFVARRLLSVLAGRDVAPHAKKNGPRGDDVGGAKHVAGFRPRISTGLQARMEAAEVLSSVEAPPPFPQLLETLGNALLLDAWDGEDMKVLQCDPSAGPFLQALLRACQGNQ